MEYGLNNIVLVLLVEDRKMVSSLSERIQRQGFTFFDIHSIEDISKHMSTKQLQFICIPKAKTIKNILSDYIHTSNPLSFTTSDIFIISTDLTSCKIGKNSHKQSLNKHLTLSEVEREHIITTLNKCSWRCKTAAKLLGINRTTLYRKMKKYGIKE
jgi:transcriptional regulator with GAF, ATPase, and Fis domain